MNDKQQIPANLCAEDDIRYADILIPDCPICGMPMCGPNDTCLEKHTANEQIAREHIAKVIGDPESLEAHSYVAKSLHREYVILAEAYERLRLENHFLERRIEAAKHATKLAFPDGLEHEPWIAYCHAQRQCREALDGIGDVIAYETKP